ncbi:PAP2 superfamily protein [Mesorhizobium albiziae]|uniref:PAP2 superfamily protein n=1 Tax=Neomesorhizobium albiziae TaxID=335020 RepID=A0A1I4DU58_9HYPH|nr:hypothetical protein GCM10007937_54010 [Mesorhizobium albiziae]SFK95586.1 PAP2 superfamily protein [Mesorhizobium albiziae]
MLRFHPAERTIMLATAALAVACFVLAYLKDVGIEPWTFTATGIFAVVAIALGQFYRIVRDGERIALTAIAIGLFAPWTFVGWTYNILLLPRYAAPIDPILVQADALFGYSWPAICAWIAQYPQISELLRQVYNLTLVQLLFTFMFLGFALDRPRLHAAAMAMVLASLMTIFCWGMFPSNGASAYWTLDPAIDRIVRPVVDSSYGAELNRQLVEGVRSVSDVKATGLIGFPSFHTVMALMTLVAAWPYRIARLVLIVVNAALFPAILIHGGHNLMDVFGGVAVTLISWFLAVRIYGAQDAHEKARTGAALASSPVQAA